MKGKIFARDIRVPNKKALRSYRNAEKMVAKFVATENTSDKEVK